MTIETKFNLNDKVWMMENNRPVEKTVYGVRVGLVFEHSVHINAYCVHQQGVLDDRFWPYENKLFSSKEELIATL